MVDFPSHGVRYAPLYGSLAGEISRSASCPQSPVGGTSEADAVADNLRAAAGKV